MHDWRAYVRRSLPPLPCPTPREVDVIEELAAQLEHVYQAARSNGASDEEAFARAEAEVPDWQALARDVLQATYPQTSGARALLMKDVVPKLQRSSTGQALLTLVLDVRYAARALRRAPMFTLMAVLTLALGIAASTAVFSLVHGVLLAPLPFREASRLAVVLEVVPEIRERYPLVGANARSFTAWTDNCRTSCEDLAALGRSTATLTGEGEPEGLTGARVSPNLFDLLGIRPARGRVFLPEESTPGRDRVVVLSDAVWQRRFGGDPRVIGQTISLDGVPIEVVGVLPPSPRLPRIEQLSVMPLAFGDMEYFRPIAWSDDAVRSWGEYDYVAFLRLKEGVTSAAAEAELASVTQAAFADAPVHPAPVVRSLLDHLVGPVRRSLWLLLAAVGAGLLVACVNLTNLLAVRWAGRRRELAIRTAMGAEIRALARLVVTESVLLAAAGGLAGLVLAFWGVRLIVWLAGSSIPRIQEVTLDATAFAWAAALTLVSAVLCALVPAWRAVGIRPFDALKAGSHTATDGRRWTAARTGLVAGEVALSGALLTVGALLLVSFGNVLRIDRGFEVDSVLAVDLTLPATRYQNAQARARFFDELLASLKMRPGVQAAGVVRKAPLEGEATVDALIPFGTDKVLADQPVANHLAVSPDYFQAMRMPLLHGRIFSEADRGRLVAVVTERTARTIWPGEDPVGQVFSRSRGDRTWEVVGVVRDARIHGLDREPGLVAYPAYWDGGTPGDMTLVVRTAGDPTAWVRTVRDVVTGLDPQLPLQRIRTMSGVLETAVATRRFQLLLMLAFSGAGLLLACLGVYGVISTIAARQEREFALRLALGATRAQVMALVVRRGLSPMMIGVCAGLALGAAASRTVSSLLFGVDPLEPLIMSGVAAVLVLLTAVACLAPAWRAARTSPSTMLRAV